jgi:hypothetical protein
MNLRWSNRVLWISLLLLAVLWQGHREVACSEEWGFFGHRRINRLAVFTLPPEMIGFYKKHLEFITEHAVDPDKRRYATRHEAVRHYIDIDHWDTYPFTAVPRDWTDALVKYTDVYLVESGGDTIQLFGQGWHERQENKILFSKGPLENQEIAYQDYRAFFQKHFLGQYYEDYWQLDCQLLADLLPFNFDNCTDAFAVDRFSEYGILPYHLLQMQRRLTDAFVKGDVDLILRLSTEFGHYIGDAHVPLHTTENYNGQLTNQVGIHAFWESRLPELFADKTYDFFVGKADYIADPGPYYWDVVLTSHSYKESVLRIERELRERFPQDKQFCYEERLGRTIRTQCEDFARAYHEELDGQVEARFRAAILSIGSAWYSAWVDAGQPDLSRLGQKNLSEREMAERLELEQALQKGESKGRKHDDY